MATKITRRGGILLGITGALILGGGIALAAFLLSSSVSGQTGFVDSSASDQILTAVGTNNGGVDCSSAAVTGNGDGVSVDPKVKRLTVEGGAAQVTGGTCTVTITYKNTGTEQIRAEQFTADQVPDGWTITGTAGSTSSKLIAPGGTGEIVLTITATDQAQAGGISGKITSATS